MKEKIEMLEKALMTKQNNLVQILETMIGKAMDESAEQ